MCRSQKSKRQFPCDWFFLSRIVCICELLCVVSSQWKLVMLWDAMSMLTVYWLCRYVELLSRLSDWSDGLIFVLLEDALAVTYYRRLRSLLAFICRTDITQLLEIVVSTFLFICWETKLSLRVTPRLNVNSWVKSIWSYCLRSYAAGKRLSKMSISSVMVRRVSDETSSVRRRPLVLFSSSLIFGSSCIQETSSK